MEDGSREISLVPVRGGTMARETEGVENRKTLKEKKLCHIGTRIV